MTCEISFALLLNNVNGMQGYLLIVVIWNVASFVSNVSRIVQDDPDHYIEYRIISFMEMFFMRLIIS